MNFDKAIKLLVSIIICELAGVIGSFYTASEIQGWYAGLKKPFFNPPNWIFGPVWSILFLLMGIALYLVWEKNFVIKNFVGSAFDESWNKVSGKFWSGSWQKLNIILIFSAQLVLNILWSLIFFGSHNPAAAFFELLMLWVAIVYTIVNFYRVSKVASYLLIPYILWVTFAGILNLSIWILN